MSTQHVVMQTLARDEIAKKVRDSQRGLVLYNPSKEWRTIQALAGEVVFPPDLGGKLVQHPRLRETEGPAKGQFKTISANGLVEVVDRAGFKPVRAKGGRVKLQVVMMPGQTALEIVQHICGKHPDIAYLTGNKAEDAKAKEMARRNHLTRIVTEARRVVQGYTEYVARFRANHPGEDPNPPTERQRKSMQVVTENETVKGWRAFVCRTCYLFDTDEFVKYEEHMLKKHNMVASKPEKIGARDLDMTGDDGDAAVAPPNVVGGGSSGLRGGAYEKADFQKPEGQQ